MNKYFVIQIFVLVLPINLRDWKKLDKIGINFLIFFKQRSYSQKFKIKKRPLKHYSQILYVCAHFLKCFAWFSRLRDLIWFLKLWMFWPNITVEIKIKQIHSFWKQWNFKFKKKICETKLFLFLRNKILFTKYSTYSASKCY